MVIELVSASKLKNDFVKYESDEIEKLSNEECDKYVESLVAELFKNYKDGGIVENPDAETISDLLDDYNKIAEKKFSNADAVVKDRKMRYFYSAYLTAHIVNCNHKNKEMNDILIALLLALSSNFKTLIALLNIYHGNYSNYGMLNELMYNLSTAYDLDVTFDIHEKIVYSDDFGVNNHLMKDLDVYIESIVECILRYIDFFDSTVGVDEIINENYFDNCVDIAKSCLKDTFAESSDFEKVALTNSGFDDAIFDMLNDIKSEIDIVSRFIEIKDEFMKMYNGNAFEYLSEIRFETRNKIDPERYDDYDEFMKYEPKYDLKECKLIKPEKQHMVY